MLFTLLYVVAIFLVLVGAGRVAVALIGTRSVSGTVTPGGQRRVLSVQRRVGNGLVSGLRLAGFGVALALAVFLVQLV